MRPPASRSPLACLALVVAMTASACASQESAAPPALAPSAAGARVYVSNETAGTVAVIDAASGTIEAQIAVGKRPRGLRLSPDGTRLFVALSGSPISPPGVDESKLPPPDRSADGIGVVDISARRLERTYPSGQDPEAFDISSDGRWLYVSNEETAEMSVLDLQAGRIVRTVAVGEEPEGVTIAPDGRTVWVTCETDHTVVGVDTSSHEVIGRVETARRPRSIVFTPDGQTMFVTGELSSAVSVVDPVARKATHTIALAPESTREGQPRPLPMGAALSPDGRTLYVSNGRHRSVSVVDVATRTLTRTIQDVGIRPWGIGISPEGRTLYTANGPGGDVSVIDVARGVVTSRISLGGSPWGIAVSR